MSSSNNIQSAITNTFGNKLRLRVSGIYIKNDEILLVKHKSINKEGILWAPPGGGMEFGETAEATSAGSSGQYSTPGWVAPNKKQWRGRAKTQIPGGKFVTIKKKCQTFPYCNQGDINALKLSKNESVKEAIDNIA